MVADTIERLSAEIAACRVCRDAPLGGPDKALPHEPRPVVVLSRTARVLIASQAPGLRVHETGLPFNDASGNRLRDWMGVTREQFYDPSLIAIMPMGLCFPGYDRNGGDMPPRRECAPLWRARGLALMPQIELVLTVGQYAHKWHIAPPKGETMTETVHRWKTILATPTNGPAILPLPHPSWRNTGWLKRNPWFEAELLPELKKLVQCKIG